MEPGLGLFRTFLLESGLAYQQAIMSKHHLISDGLNLRDVEKYPQCVPPPLSFILSKREESTGSLTIVKVKKSNSSTEIVTAFRGTDPENYIKPMDLFLV